MVPVPLPPSDVKANSVVMFFPSSSKQLQDLRFQALSTKREIQTASSSSHSSSCLPFEVKLTESGQRYTFLVETVRQRGEKMPAVCLKEELVVCMPCPAPGYRQGIYSWLFVLFLVPNHMTRERNGLMSESLVPDLIK